MGDEDPGRRDVPPAKMPGAQAEIGLRAIALREAVLAHQAGGVDAVAPQIEANRVADGDVDGLRAVGPPRQRASPAPRRRPLPDAPGGPG